MKEYSTPDESIAPSTGARLATCLRHIQGKYPSLVIRLVHVERGGQRSAVLAINDTLVFRFPLTAEGVETLPIEVAILRAIRARLPLPTPDPTYESLETHAVGTTFVGYTRLPGKPLSRETLLAQDDTTRQTLAAQLARFLRALHGIPAAALPPDLPVQDGHHQWVDLYARIREKLFPFVNKESRAIVAQHFESYLAELYAASYHPVLRHGDFGPTNILFDGASRTISGIIDFGSAGLGDPALDIAGVMGPFGYGETFVHSFTRSYSAIPTLLPRARFYAGTFALQEALWGLEHGDSAAFNSGIAALPLTY